MIRRIQIGKQVRLVARPHIPAITAASLPASYKLVFSNASVKAHSKKRIFYIHLILPAGTEHDYIPLMADTVTGHRLQIDESSRYDPESGFGDRDRTCTVGRGEHNIFPGNLFRRIIKRRISEIGKTTSLHIPFRSDQPAFCLICLSLFNGSDRTDTAHPLLKAAAIVVVARNTSTTTTIASGL